jgi:hypothetical protein
VTASGPSEKCRLLAADVVGYSRLMGRDESGTLARFRSATKQRKHSSKIAQMRRADWVRKGLLLGVDRTYGGHHETDAFDP